MAERMDGVWSPDEATQIKELNLQKLQVWIHISSVAS